jgi:hypothetical protein
VVPLVRTQVPLDASVTVRIAGERRALVQQIDMAALALRPVDRVRIDAAPLVFVGYGVHAPERGWDDYKDLDLQGKVAVFLINDPISRRWLVTMPTASLAARRRRTTRAGLTSTKRRHGGARSPR